MSEQIYLVEITGAIDAAGTLEVLRLTDSSLGYATRPGETPPSTPYLPCLESAGALRREMFSGSSPSGASEVGYGEVVAVAAGELDHIRSWGFAGRPLTVRRGPHDGAYPADFPVVFSGTVADVSIEEDQVRFRLRDRLAELRRPLLTARYGGTNALPAGIDGTADDLAGRVIPRVFGRVLNITPPCVNTARLIYQASGAALADIPAVYVAGVALGRGADYVSEADMQANAPAAGQYRAWLAGGCLRLGAAPGGAVTCDATQGAALANRTPAQLLSALAQAMGVPAGDIVAADVTALDAAAGYECGVWVSSEESALALMDLIAGSCGAWYGFDHAGDLRMGRLAAPAGTPVATLTRLSIVELARLAQDRVPHWQTVIRYQRNWTVQGGAEVAGAVTAARRAWLNEASRSVTDSDAAVLTQHLLSEPFARDTVLLSASDAAAQAAHDQALFGVHRDTFRVAVELSSAQQTAIDLGCVVELLHPRFDLAAGRLFRVLAIESDLSSGSTELVLWGPDDEMPA